MNKKRILVYFICLLLFVALIIAKQQQVRSMRNKPIISTFSQWRQNGKPVFVKRVFPHDVSLFTKLTLRPAGNEVFEGYVPKAIQEKLAAGQDIYAEPDDSSVIGSISGVSKGISLDTGMFCVQAIFKKSVDSGSWLVVYVNTGTLCDVICVLNDIIDRQNEKTYVWKVEEGRAIKQEIEIGQHNGYGAIVLEGLGAGDLIVYKGFTLLSENDSVNIIKNIDDSGVKP